jgi:hypothetical protein
MKVPQQSSSASPFLFHLTGMINWFTSRDEENSHSYKGEQLAAGSCTSARDDTKCCQSHLTSTILPVLLLLLLLMLANIRVTTSFSTILTTASKPASSC